jgi:hypothetical protein
MASNSKRKSWETFVRRPTDLPEGVEIPLVLRDLNPGRRKYGMRHVVAIVGKDEHPAQMDLLYVRTVVGVLLPEPMRIKILRELPIELPGQAYRDFFGALRAAAKEAKQN